MATPQNKPQADPQVNWSTAQPVGSSQMDWGNATPVGQTPQQQAQPTPQGNGPLDRLAAWGQKTFPHLTPEDEAKEAEGFGGTFFGQHGDRILNNAGSKLMRGLTALPASVVDSVEDTPEMFAHPLEYNARKHAEAVANPMKVLPPGEQPPTPTLTDVEDYGSDLAGDLASSYLVGKATGGVTRGGAKLLGKAAPNFAETALKMRIPDRAYGATPGRAILEDTKGITPHSVIESGRQSLKNIGEQQSSLLGDAEGDVSLVPARGVLNDFYDRAVAENHPGTIKDIGKLRTQLERWFGAQDPDTPDAQIPTQVRPAQAAALNRGISNALTSWNPATTNDTMTAAGRMAHHQLGESIADVVPEIKPLNQRVQSLMPVISRATSADLSAPLLQRLQGRAAAHTGALAGALAGYHFGGVPGALLGFAGPEIAAMPETSLIAARGAHAGSKALQGASLFTGPAAGATAFSAARKQQPRIIEGQ